uniref:Peptidylglycine monooxygenase n=1 Tax=Romanomermis culicivorax TaxID=13658 RepID=A0A915HG78_ROMCU
MPGVQPSQDEEYLCFAVEVSDPGYIVQFVPTANADRVHHLLLYGCDVPGHTPGEPWNCLHHSICHSSQSILYAWARNAPPLTLPGGVGVPVGKSVGISYYVLQVHYATTFVGSVYDYSGVKLKMSTKKPPYLGGIYLFVAGYPSIPPETKEFPINISCKYEGKAVVHPFAYRTHAHSLGRIISAFKYKDDKWTKIGKGNPQWPQRFYPVDKPVEILNGDTLAAQCIYNSVGRKTETNIGSFGKDEMCNFYMYYYVDADHPNPFGSSDAACSWPGDSKLFRKYPAEAYSPFDENQQLLHTAHAADHRFGNFLVALGGLKKTLDKTAILFSKWPLVEKWRSYWKKYFLHLSYSFSYFDHENLVFSNDENEILREKRQFGGLNRGGYPSYDTNNDDSFVVDPSAQQFKQHVIKKPGPGYPFSIRNRGIWPPRVDEYQQQQNLGYGADETARVVANNNDNSDGAAVSMKNQPSTFRCRVARRACMIVCDLHDTKAFFILGVVESKDWPISNIPFGQISGLTTDSNGNLVVFHRSDRVWDENSFNLTNYYMQRTNGPIMDDTVLTLNANGSIIKRWGRGFFYLPHGIFSDPKGFLWFTDVAMHQVFKFDPKNEVAKPLLTLGQEFKPGSDETHFCKPSGVAVATDGTIFVADGYCNDRIMKFGANGKFLSQFGEKSMDILQDGYPKLGTFTLPHALSLDEANRILYVADRENFRVQIFDFNGYPVDQLTSKEFGTSVYGVHYCANADIVYIVNGPSTEPKPIELKVFAFDAKTRRLMFSFGPGHEHFQRPHVLSTSSDCLKVIVGEIGPNKLWRFEVSSLGPSHLKQNDIKPVTKPISTDTLNNLIIVDQSSRSQLIMVAVASRALI